MLSEATILKYVWQRHQALARWEQGAIAQLLTFPTLPVDETSLRRSNGMVAPSLTGIKSAKVECVTYH